MPISGIITPFIEKLVIPKLESFANSIKKDIQLNLIPIQDHFREYFQRTYSSVSYINTIAFKNSRRLLDEIYQPLTLTLNTKETKEIYKIISYPQDLLEKYNKTLIIDTAGMGKSTLSKKIFLDTIRYQKEIPIFIELRRLSRDNTILNQIQEQLNSINKVFDQELLLDLLAQGGFLILLDGYDEIRLQDKEIVTNDLQKFINRTYNNRFILTSRPEESLTSFGEFQGFIIKPLNKEEAFSLLKKYDKSDNNAALLINRIEQEYDNMREFLTNPLLVSLLFTAFEYKPKIPTKKHLFYSQVFEALFESHDLAKGAYEREKKCGLDIDDFKKVMRHLGYFSFIGGQGIEYSKDKLIELVKKSMAESEISFKPSCFIEDLITTVPLFTKEGLFYKWTHKSLQEYFVAQFINEDSDEKRKDILLAMYRSEHIQNYINIFDLFYDINIKIFTHTIISEIVSSYFTYYTKSMYNSTNYPTINTESIRYRRELTFSKTLLLPITKDHELEDHFHNETFKVSPPNSDVTMYKFDITRQEFNTIIFIKYKVYIILELLNKKAHSIQKRQRKFKEKIQGEKTRFIDEIVQYIIIKDPNMMNSLFEITDTPDNILNGNDIFDKGNSLLDFGGMSSIINEEEALKLYHDLNAKSIKDEKNNSLTEGL